MACSGFPTAKKWQFVRAEAAPRLVALNADEGEPGTFKDRFCMETDPHRVLEGLLIAAWVIEADEVFFYLRDEYAAARAIERRPLGECRRSRHARVQVQIDGREDLRRKNAVAQPPSRHCPRF